MGSMAGKYTCKKKASLEHKKGYHVTAMFKSHLFFPFSKFHLEVSINWPDFFFQYNDLIYLTFTVLRLLVE